MLNIIINDPITVLSKTQRKKIRKMVTEKWNPDLEYEFTEELDKMLSEIYYDDETKRYNMCKFEYCRHNECLTLMFEQVHIQTVEERHEELRKKLHDKMKTKHNAANPEWKMYEQIRSRMPEAQKKMIPDPDKVRSDMTTYRTMMTMLPNQNPIYQYLSMLIPPE